MVVGGWEPNTVPALGNGCLPTTFGPELFSGNFDRFEQHAIAAIHRIPSMGSAGAQTLVNGTDTIQHAHTPSTHARTHARTHAHAPPIIACLAPSLAHACALVWSPPCSLLTCAIAIAHCTALRRADPGVCRRQPFDWVGPAG